MKCTEFIEQAIENFDKVLLITDGFRAELKPHYIDKIVPAGKKLLILSSRQMEAKGTSVSYERIPEELISQLRQLYHTYAFTDNFILLEESPLYATVFNYVQAGLLSPEEAWQALLE